MVANCEKYQPYISLDRVIEIPDVARDLVQCYLCHGLIWYPVNCKTCDKIFCSQCIHIFHQDQSEQKCPHGCTTYVQGRVFQGITQNMLPSLRITCRYKSNKCTEILLYNELERHEQMCDYQLQSCDGCQQEIIKKNFDQHHNECQLVSIKCDQCSTSYLRKDSHTLTECLYIQFQQQKSKVEQLERQIVDQQTKINQMEEKLATNDTFWATFFGIVNEKNEQINS